jgi:peptidoglycan LD-endopeptidase CwlK
MSTKLEDLLPDIQFKARHAINELKEKGIPFVVTSTLRTTEEQYALYLQGRSTLDMVNKARFAAKMRPISQAENVYKVTNCDGSSMKSRHQGGRAIDVVPAVNGNPVWPHDGDPRWQQIADVMKSSGFQWGGDWAAFIDPPHYEIL